MLQPYATQIVETIREPLLLLDEALTVRFANRAFHRQFELAHDEVIGRRIYDLGDGDWDLPELHRLLEEILPRDSSFEDLEVEQRFRILGRRRMILNVRRLEGPAAVDRLVLLVVTEVSERRADEIERARLAAIVDSSQDAIIVQTVDGTITDWNEGAERIYEFSADEAIGRHISIIVPPELQPAMQENREKLRAGRRLQSYETERVRKDGRRIHISLTMSPLRDSTGQVTLISTIERDITRRVRIEQELRKAKERAERAERTRGEFLANVSHELRTPISAIIGMTDLALQEELSYEVRDYLETARTSADVLLELINEVLDFSKLESGEFDLDEEPFQLSEVLESTVKTLGLRAYEKGLELACDLAAGIPDRLSGDPQRLRQALTNLAGNAVKFTNQGEVVIGVEQVQRLGVELKLTFYVRDTGIGISADDQQRIFEPFTQADASRTRSYGGTGLGLAITRQIVARMGGRLWVDSLPGSGSTFYFTAHLKVAGEGAATPTAARAGRIRELDGLPVLIVDDNETNRRILERVLQNWSMCPESAANAATAMRKLREAFEAGRAYPLVILDALMPDVDGFTLAAQIKSDHRLAGATVLMLSSADRQAFRERTEDLEVSAFLEKPVTQSNLLDSIVTALGGVPLKPMPAAEQAGGPPERPLKILLAEDAPANQKVVKRILEKRGHFVQIAHNGREVIDLVDDAAYDLVLMDVQMPIMDGFQATAAVRQHADEHVSRIPVIAITAHAMRGDRERCLAAGMDAYISKPIDAARLIRLVERIADNPRVGGLPPSDSVSWDAATPRPVQNTGPVDLPAALKRLGGDRGLLEEMAGFFQEDAPVLLDQLEAAAGRDDPQTAQRAAHSLKGLCANFNAQDAMDSAARLEHLAESQNVAAVLRELPHLQTEVERVLESLRRFVS